MIEHWEYLVRPNLNEEELNKLGAQGWELTAAAVKVDGFSLHLFFKRPTGHEYE